MWTSSWCTHLNFHIITDDSADDKYPCPSVYGTIFFTLSQDLNNGLFDGDQTCTIFIPLLHPPYRHHVFTVSVFRPSNFTCLLVPKPVTHVLDFCYSMSPLLVPKYISHTMITCTKTYGPNQTFAVFPELWKITKEMAVSIAWVLKYQKPKSKWGWN